MAIVKKDDDQDILDRINEKLMSIKDDLDKYYGDNNDRKAVLYIEHSGQSRKKGQAEEIEPEFQFIKFLDPQ